MTADLNVTLNVSNSETEDKCGLDMSSYEELPTPAADCNGVKDGNESGMGDREDDPDASYVFVVGNNTVPVETADSADLNGKSEPVHNVGSCDNDIENEVAESEVDHGIEAVKVAAIEVDTSSPFNNGVISKDGKVLNGAIEVPTGTSAIVGLEALDDQSEGEEGHVELDSTGGLKGTGDLSEAVEPEPEPELMQVKFGDVKAGEENSSIVSPESQFTTYTDVAESETNHSGDVDFAMSADVAESELKKASVLEVKSSELQPDESGNFEVTSSVDVAELERNQFHSVEVSCSIDVSESEPNQYSNDEVKIEGVREMNLGEDVKGNQDSQSAITEGFIDGDLDNQGQEPVGFSNNPPLEGPQKESEVVLEQNTEKIPCLAVADIKLEEREVIDASACNAYENGLSAGHIEDTVAERIVVNGFVSASQNTSEQNNSSREGENLISCNAKIGTNETPSFIGTETGKSSPSASDNDTIGHPTDEINKPVVQLTSEDIHGHITHEKGELLPTDHQESVSQTIANGFAHANQTTSEVVRMVVHQNVAIENFGSTPVALASDTVLEPVVEAGDSCHVAVDVTDINDDTRTETLVEMLDVNSGENVGSHSIGDREIVIEPDHNQIVTETMPSWPENDAEPEIEADSTAIESGEVSTPPNDEVDKESEFSTGAPKCSGSNAVSVGDPDRETCIHDSVENPVGVRAGPEVEHSPMASKEVISNDERCASECEGQNGSVITSERAINCIQDDENEGDQLVTIDGEEKAPQEMEVTDKVTREELSTSSPEGSSVDASEGQNAAVEVGKKPFYYMIRIPRYEDDENLREQIKHAQFQVDETTKSRDVIRAEMQRKRAICNEHGARVDAAISEEVAVRNLLKSKRKEIDSALSLINKVKSAFSVGDIDSKIRNMEHMIQHETLPLKEEKSYIREIKQLKQTREQLSSSLGSQEDIQEAIDQKDQVEERLKLLRKEADQLRENVLKAEAAIRNAKKTCQDENAKLNEVVAQFRAADDVRQEAYAHLQSLRKRLYDKNKHFWNYRDDSKLAYDLASQGNKEELQRHCVNQVERVMDLWNNNDEFQKEYIRCNMRSTVRRLQTLDGRSLGPDEVPPAIPVVVSERIAKDNIKPPLTALESKKTIAPTGTEKTDDKSTANVGNKNNLTAKPKKIAQHAPLGNGFATISGRNEIEEAWRKEEKQTKEDKQTKEEEELARKAEELRKQEEAAILKEHQRLEEKAKAKEAMERKKRNAAKAQARAALRAQKEAEEKEKEREKRARKKEKKKAVAEETNTVNEGESSPGIEPPIETKESETREKPMTVTKRAHKPLHFTKQTKSKSMPPPLRNRGKRRMEIWMWVLLAALAVFGLFLMGNGTISLKGLGF